MKNPFLYTGFLLVLLMTGCNQETTIANEDDLPSEPATANTVVEVVMKDVEYSPTKLEIGKGITVEWRNDDLVPHTVTSPTFGDSGSIAPGETWEHTFIETGEFPYSCTFHPDMKGVVIVE